MTLNNEYDYIIVNAVNLSNIYIFSSKNDPYKIVEYLKINNISYNDIESILSVLYELLVEFQEKDYSLQYDKSIIKNNFIIPPVKKDTVITLNVLQNIENLTPEHIKSFDKKELNSLIYSIQQATVNGIKFQLRYAIETLNKILDDDYIWNYLGIN